MITDNDKILLKKKGITEEKLNGQLLQFVHGFPYLRLSAAASTEKGILALSGEEQQKYLKDWERYTAEDHHIVKFVPASGAASRMFKDMFAFLDAGYDRPATDFEKIYFERLNDAAFRQDLDEACKNIYGKDIDSLLSEGKYKEVTAAMLTRDGLNYGSLPKGLLKFHRYTEGARTPLEEHLVEGALYARQKDGSVNVHFTVSPEHKPLFEALVKEKAPLYAEKFGVEYHISFSEQKSSTDTIAANPDNTPFREDGKLLFRPGGHGALIENLNDIDSAVVFIKNIDNVVGDSHREDTIHYKKFIGGLLMIVRDRIAALSAALASDPTEETVSEATAFVENILFIHSEGLAAERSLAERRDVLLSIFDRPLRVSGMVRNEGEPGGGPYNAYSSDGKTIAPQILESTQIDMNNAENVDMMKNAGYFNPVDLVCYIKDDFGKTYNLPAYVDQNTGFISSKSLHGKDLRALELPGLWNGAMSDWNTAFVEVPAETFNPVKTVNDLLRPAHQQK